MAHEEQLKILVDGGVGEWNQWRQQNPRIKADLREADLSEVNLSGVNLRETDLREADLSGARVNGEFVDEGNSSRVVERLTQKKSK